MYAGTGITPEYSNLNRILNGNGGGGKRPKIEEVRRTCDLPSHVCRREKEEGLLLMQVFVLSNIESCPKIIRQEKGVH
jgi:hypothetical protein